MDEVFRKTYFIKHYNLVRGYSKEKEGGEQFLKIIIEEVV
jgi:hypothetical protein